MTSYFFSKTQNGITNKDHHPWKDSLKQMKEEGSYRGNTAIPQRSYSDNRKKQHSEDGVSEQQLRQPKSAPTSPKRVLPRVDMVRKAEQQDSLEISQETSKSSCDIVSNNAPKRNNTSNNISTSDDSDSGIELEPKQSPKITLPGQKEHPSRKKSTGGSVNSPPKPSHKFEPIRQTTKVFNPFDSDFISADSEDGDSTWNEQMPPMDSSNQTSPSKFSDADPFSHLSSQRSTTPNSTENPFSGLKPSPSNSVSGSSSAEDGKVHRFQKPPRPQPGMKNTNRLDPRAVTMANNYHYYQQKHSSSNKSTKQATTYKRRSNNSYLSASSNNTSTSTTSSDNSCEQMGLHILCAEANSKQDIAWRNALYLLGMQPQLAHALEPKTGRLPLHTACMGGTNKQKHQQEQEPQEQGYKEQSAPPSFMIHALFIAHTGAVRHVDQDGRLPLHWVATTSGDVETMQLLVDAYPESVYQKDAMGLTPLHLLLSNSNFALCSIQQAQVLLGMTTKVLDDGKKDNNRHGKRVLQRHGGHLKLPYDQLHRLSPHHQHKQPRHFILTAEVLERYPEDVQVCLKRLSHFDRKNLHEDSTPHQSGHPWNSPDSKGNKREKNQGTPETTAMGQEASFLSFSSLDFSRHPPADPAESNPAAIATPDRCQLPLHMIVERGMLVTGLRHRQPERRKQLFEQQHLVLLVRLLISAYPPGLIEKDDNGYTSLLLAMVTPKDALPSQELLELLLGKRTAGFESLPQWAQDISMPVHYHQGSARAVERYSNPAMVAMVDTCQLPLHVAAEELGSNYSLMLAIFESYPGAIHVQDARGRLPLHVLLQNYRRIAPDPRIIALLLSDRAAQTCNDEGELPFDLLLRCSSSLPFDSPSTKFLSRGSRYTLTQPTTPDVCEAFQKFFQSTILIAPEKICASGIASKGRHGMAANVFLWRLRSLPPWLRRQACSAPFVQELLVEELASPGKCAFILLYGCFLGLLIAMFRLQMSMYIDTSSSPLSDQVISESDPGIISSFLSPSTRYSPWTTLAIYGLTAGLISCQAVFWALSLSLNEFQHLCLHNIWRWIDLGAVILATTTTVMIHEVFPDDLVLVMGTAATGLLWFSVIGYLSHWWYGMSVFSGAIVKIAQMVLWPGLVAAIFVIGFAEMFYTFSQVNCQMGTSDAAVCKLRDAYRLVYFLSVGEPIVDLGSDEEMTSGMTFLVALFLAIGFLLLLSLLAAVMIVASKCDGESVALDSFWEPKLAFVLSSQDTRAAAAARQKKTMLTPPPSCMDRWLAKLGHFWEVNVCFLYGRDNGRSEGLWYLIPNSSCTGFFLRVWAAFVLPSWIIVGLATMGLLWPPQVRRFIFRPRGGMENKTRPAEVSAFIASQVSDVRNEVLKMKDMSYDQSNDVRREIQELKAMIMALKD